jgi:hypothetical protein
LPHHRRCTQSSAGSEGCDLRAADFPYWLRAEPALLFTRRNSTRHRLRTPSACRVAVAGRPRRLPFCRVGARPAHTRSCGISLSNSAKTDSSAPIARPAGEVRSSASVIDTMPTPRGSSSYNLQCGEEVGYGSSPVIQPPHQHNIDFPTGIAQLPAASPAVAAGTLRSRLPPPEEFARSGKSRLPPAQSGKLLP